MKPRLHLINTRITLAQSGVVLPMVLIFLVIMTLLGITAIRNVTLEEKMAVNSRYQQLAFQAGEFALRSCERDVLDPILPVPALPLNWCNGGATGLMIGKFFDQQTCMALNAAPVWGLAAPQWNNANFSRNVVLPAAYNGLVTARCMVERLKPTPPTPPSVTLYCPYRVTARVDDANGGGTAVLLQSYMIAPLSSGRGCRDLNVPLLRL